MAQDITVKFTQDEKKAIKYQLTAFQKNIGETLKKPMLALERAHLLELEKTNSSILRKLG